MTKSIIEKFRQNLLQKYNTTEGEIDWLVIDSMIDDLKEEILELKGKIPCGWCEDDTTIDEVIEKIAGSENTKK